MNNLSQSTQACRLKKRTSRRIYSTYGMSVRKSFEGFKNYLLLSKNFLVSAILSFSTLPVES